MPTANAELSEDRVATAIEEKSVVVVEANHRIANNLSLLVSLARMRAVSLVREERTLTAAEAGALLGEMASRIESVGRLHRLLCRAPASEAVDLGEYLHEVCEALAASHGDSQGTTLSFTCAPCTVPPGIALSLALLVGELVTNAFKYAHPSGVRGRVDVLSRTDGDGMIEVEVEDDGVGLPPGFDPYEHGGMGFRVVHALGTQIGATTRYLSSGLGLCCRITLPRPPRG